jgi:acyl-CoA synthetase (AMP-forming)/AMP-acid ligase II
MTHFNLADLFECVADHVPGREALVYGGRRLTFAQLDERANRFAHFLQSRGVGPGDHVGIYAYNCNEWVEAALSAFKIRAVPVNINFRYVEEELRYLLDDSDSVALVYHRELAPRVEAVAPSVSTLETLVVIEDGTTETPPPLAAKSERGTGGEVRRFQYESAIAGQSPKRDFGERSGEDLYLIYTGGTTGMPKGVMWRHEDVFFAGLQGGNPGGPPIAKPEEIGPAAAARAAPPTTMPVAPLMHGNGFWSVIIGLNGGGKCVLATSRRLDPHEIWSLVEREKVNVMSIVGDAMARPMTEALYRDGASYDTSSLMVISSAGAIWSEHVKEKMRGKLGCLLIDAFGATESGHQGMNLGKHDGRPKFNVDANTSVLDDEMRRVAPGSGVVGRLARSGRLPQGYWKDPEKTARTFMTDPDGVRWVVPGDMATIESDGSITLLGRGSLCINSGGEKIYPEEVEQALKSHPSVFDAVVVGVPDERWGERVAAVVQARAGASPTLADLDAHCRTKVSGYKVPRELHLVDEIVRSPSGKADYRWAKSVATGNKA